ncbi:hypothetical protein Tco_0189389 [Tanacetum coccineum]
MAAEVSHTLKYMGGQLNAAPMLEDFQYSPDDEEDTRSSRIQDSPDDEEDTRSSQEYLNDLEEEYQERTLLAKSKRFFKKGSQRLSSAKATNELYATNVGEKFLSTKPKLRPTKDFEAKYNKVKAKMALLSSSPSSSKSSMVKNKGLVAEAYEWNEEDVSSDDNEMVKVKVHTLLTMEDNDDRKTFLDYLCIDLNYVEEQRNNLLLKHRDLVQELNTCKEQCEQILTQKKRILRVDQVTEDPFSSGQKDLVFVKSLVDDTKVSIPGFKRPWLSETEAFILPNHETGRILSLKSQVKIIDPSVTVTDSSLADYDSTDESSICSILFPPLEKLVGAEPVSGPKSIKSILKSNSTLKAETLKGVTINEPSSAPVKENEIVSAFKKNSAPPGKLKSVKTEDDFPLSIEAHLVPEQDSGCSRHMTDVKSYLHKYVEQPGPKVVFGDDSICTTEGYGFIKCNGLVFTKVAFVNDLKCPVFIHNHKDHLEKFDKKADDGYFLGYSLVYKSFRVLNTKRQQTEETCHITFNESSIAIKFSKSSVDDINIAESERYPPDKYLHPYEPSQRYQVDCNIG